MRIILSRIKGQKNSVGIIGELPKLNHDVHHAPHGRIARHVGKATIHIAFDDVLGKLIQKDCVRDPLLLTKNLGFRLFQSSPESKSTKIL